MAADVVSKIGTLWYTNAGAMDRIDNFFYWSKLRWKFDKVELLQRTKEWNDMGFSGVDREAIVQKYTANPCAPCANPSCKNWETEPQEFKTCSQCKQLVAYCSRDCRKKDWKAQHQCVTTYVNSHLRYRFILDFRGFRSPR
jgi:hypothetical protein